MSCPFCGSHGEPLGELGFEVWLRCRRCGMDYSFPVPIVLCDEYDLPWEADLSGLPPTTYARPLEKPRPQPRHP